MAKKVVLGATVGLVTVVSLVAPASAHRRHHHGHHHFHFRHWHAPYVTYGYGGCEYFYKKWKYTGSGFWKHKYFACIY